MATWFEITFTGEPTEADREHAAELILEGYTSGQLDGDPEPDEQDPCPTPLVHADKTEARCILNRLHLLSDSDHQDEHGCAAPVLVHQSTIREARRIEELRARGELL